MKPVHQCQLLLVVKKRNQNGQLILFSRCRMMKEIFLTPERGHNSKGDKP